MIRLSNKYKALYGSQTRYFCVTGGRGSSKSFSVSLFLLLLSFEPKHKILFTRLTMISAHLSIIPEFIEKIELLEMGDKFSVTKTEIVNLVSGSIIIFKGIKTSSGDNTANLKSLNGITTWVVDEAEELNDEVTFDKINLSIREKSQHNRVILVLNPATKEHIFYKRFFESAGVNPGFNGIKGNVTYIHTDYRDNINNLDEVFVQEVQEMEFKNPEKYKHVILGGWLDKAEGVIFTNWEVGEFVECSPPVYGQDFGFAIDPTTLVKVSIDQKNKVIYAKELLYKPKLTTSQIYSENLSHVGNSLIYGDNAEPRLIAELKSKGLNITEAIKGPGSITAGIAAIQDFKLIVSGENIVKELNNYVWHDKKSGVPVDNWNHILDALRYAVYPQLHKRGAATFGWD